MIQILINFCKLDPGFKLEYVGDRDSILDNVKKGAIQWYSQDFGEGGVACKAHAEKKKKIDHTHLILRPAFELKDNRTSRRLS